MELSELKGIGPVREKQLRAMGISSLRDLLFTLPYRYEDRVNVHPCVTAQEGQMLFSGMVDTEPKLNYFHGLSRVTVSIRDASGKLSVCWYNEPWMARQLPTDRPVDLFGRLTIKNGRRILQNPVVVQERQWIPVYHALKGIPSKAFRNIIRESLEMIDDCCPETLPRSFRLRNHLCELNFAIRQAHFPDTPESLKTARRRLSFENMLLYLMYVYGDTSRKQPGFPIQDAVENARAFWRLLSFTPTGAQKKVLDEIAADLSGDTAMSRLVQGDVGCGKTAVAFGAIFAAAGAGYQSAMMAPTEILARQHYENAAALLGKEGILCHLLTGSTKAAERRRILADLASGECRAVFGTHALISQRVQYKKLGLVITDEQHRFGVRHRSMLQEKGADGEERMPHVLVMSATPIPRTLALILYGDLDISVINELPAGRIPVKTRLVPSAKREDMYRFLLDQVRQGRQAYIVCPLIESEEEDSDLKAAKTLYTELKNNYLKDVETALTWGSQKSADKTEVLHQFSEGRIRVLVSTTVIEVGVNVPNATIMIVENAERFGLSQLHQLRGRVGRGKEESWCFLMSEATEKLRILCATNDGFQVAQKDLELRGPGDLMGTRQSGIEMQNTILSGDMNLLEEVTACVKQLHADPGLKEELEALTSLTVNVFGEKTRLIALN